MKIENKIPYQPDKNWWKLFREQLSEDGFPIIRMAKNDMFGTPVDFKYLTVKCGKFYFYLQNPEFFDGIEVVGYNVVSPYEDIQADYPKTITTYNDLVDYMHSFNPYLRWKKDEVKRRRIHWELDGVLPQKITVLNYLRKELAGNREKEIFEKLDRIETIRNDDSYLVFRFVAENGNWFDFEAKSRRITG